MPVLGSSDHGILSILNLWDSERKKGPLFSDCFTASIKIKKDATYEVPFKATVGPAGKIDLEVTNWSTKFGLLCYQEFELEGCTGTKVLSCKKAICRVIVTRDKENQKSSRAIIEHLAPVILREKIERQATYLIRVFMVDIDVLLAPKASGDTGDIEVTLVDPKALGKLGHKTDNTPPVTKQCPPNFYELNDLGKLYFSNVPLVSLTEKKSLVVTISKERSSMPDDELKGWHRKAKVFLDRLIDLFSFAQGRKVTVPIREFIVEDEVKTVFPLSDRSSSVKFMPTIQRQKDAHTIVDSLISTELVDQGDWEKVQKAINFSLSVQQFNEIGLFSKLAAIETLCNLYADSDRGFVDKIHKFMKLDKDIKLNKEKKQSLFSEFSIGKKGIEDLPLVKARNDISHSCTFNGSREELVKLMSEAHDILTRLILSTLGFKGLYCRYDMDESCNGMSELKDCQVSPVTKDRLDEFEENKGSWMSAINFRHNYINWKLSANAFIREGEDSFCIDQ